MPRKKTSGSEGIQKDDIPSQRELDCAKQKEEQRLQRLKQRAEYAREKRAQERNEKELRRIAQNNYELAVKCHENETEGEGQKLIRLREIKREQARQRRARETEETRLQRLKRRAETDNKRRAKETEEKRVLRRVEDYLRRRDWDKLAKESKKLTLDVVEKGSTQKTLFKIKCLRRRVEALKMAGMKIVKSHVQSAVERLKG